MLSCSVHRSWKKKSILWSFYLSTLEEICLSLMQQALLYTWFSFNSQRCWCSFFFFTPLLLLLCFSPRFNDDVILLFDPSTFAFPSSNLYPKAVSRHLDSESNYRSSVPFFSPNPPLWLGPAAVVKTTTLALGLDHLFSFFSFFLPLNVSVNLWNLSECSKNGPNMPGLL